VCVPIEKHQSGSIIEFVECFNTFVVCYKGKGCYIYCFVKKRRGSVCVGDKLVPFGFVTVDHFSRKKREKKKMDDSFFSCLNKSTGLDWMAENFSETCFVPKTQQPRRPKPVVYGKHTANKFKECFRLGLGDHEFPVSFPAAAEAEAALLSSPDNNRVLRASSPHFPEPSICPAKLEMSWNKRQKSFLTQLKDAVEEKDMDMCLKDCHDLFDGSDYNLFPKDEPLSSNAFAEMMDMMLATWTDLSELDQLSVKNALFFSYDQMCRRLHVSENVGCKEILKEAYSRAEYDKWIAQMTREAARDKALLRKYKHVTSQLLSRLETRE